MKILKKEMGPVHVAVDIGCHALATFPPFSQGNSILGYGMSLASAAAVSGTQENRPISIMGDGGFWHNGLLTGVAGAVLNKDDSVLIVMNNGYSSATGQQDLPSSAPEEDGRGKGVDIEGALKEPRRRLDQARAHLRRRGRREHAARSGADARDEGLKVIIADGECQLARQRRIRPERARLSAAGKRVERQRFWVDPDVCTGDHSCIRLSGCPSLTVKPNEDPLRTDPVAHVNNDCVGCGLCGEVSHAAQLCPSFAEINVIENPSLWDRAAPRRSRPALIRWFGGGTAKRHPRQPWFQRSDAMSEAKPIRLLIAALGGEGGGVLAGWISNAAIASGPFRAAHVDPGRRAAHRCHDLLS